jgi:hypothetical protein
VPNRSDFRSDSPMTLMCSELSCTGGADTEDHASGYRGVRYSRERLTVATGFRATVPGSSQPSFALDSGASVRSVWFANRLVLAALCIRRWVAPVRVECKHCELAMVARFGHEQRGSAALMFCSEQPVGSKNESPEGQKRREYVFKPRSRQI